MRVKRIIIVLLLVIGGILFFYRRNMKINDLYRYPISRNNYNDYYIYDMYLDHVNIVFYNGEEEKVEIPAYINDKPVLSIEDSAFYGNEIINEVILPSTIIKIGYQSFIGCKNLRIVHIPESVVYIGRSAFDNCPNLDILYIKKKKHEMLLKEINYDRYIKYE